MPTHATSCAAGVEKYVGLYGTVPPVWAQTLTTLEVPLLRLGLNASRNSGLNG
jgi:hypothetical protein